MLLKVWDRVRKTGGDYRFEGVVVAAFYKRDNLHVRYVVENDDGVLFIFNGSQLHLVDRPSPPVSTFPAKPRLADVIDVDLPDE